jgi:hypothetical protein
MKQHLNQHKSKKRLIFLICCAVLSGCALPPLEPVPPERINETLSRKYPTKTFTNFTAGLTCMDRMFLKYKVEPVYMTSAPIPDYSEGRGTAGYGARDMMITALSEMSKESAAIRYVAFDRTTPDIVSMQNAHPKKANLRVPDFFVRGAVTQINTAPYSKQIGDSVNIGTVGAVQGASAGGSSSVTLQSVSLDVSLGLINNYQMLPGVHSANTFSIEKNSDSNEYSLSFAKIGAIYSVNENEAQTMSLALRGLVEVSAIELFGKLYSLPYWECLAKIGQDAPENIATRQRYDEMSYSERIKYVASQLIRHEVLAAGDPSENSGEPTPAFGHAVMEYRVRSGQLGGVHVDFAVFERLVRDTAEDSKRTLGAFPLPTVRAATSPPTPTKPPTAVPAK